MGFSSRQCPSDSSSWQILTVLRLCVCAQELSVWVLVCVCVYMCVRVCMCDTCVCVPVCVPVHMSLKTREGTDHPTAQR